MEGNKKQAQTSVKYCIKDRYVHWGRQMTLLPRSKLTKREKGKFSALDLPIGLGVKNLDQLCCLDPTFVRVGA